MNIQSDLKPSSTFRSWWKYTDMGHKIMTALSFGIFWDFRNNKPYKNEIVYIDKIISKFNNKSDKLKHDKFYLYLEEDKHEKFWIANKYYGWYLESKEGTLPLTIKQIAQVDNLLKKSMKTI